MNGHATDPDAPQFLVNRRPWQPTNPLETAPVPAALRPHGTLPNTPLTASLISFSLGIVFTLGALLFALGGIQGSSWATYQLGFFIAAWAAFHWGEFAVTAGWNRDKVSIDSFLLNNGKEYHLANGTVVVEFIITAYLFPSFKRHPYVSQIGICLTLVAQVLRSAAMIHASSNFSHVVAVRKLQNHQLVTTGVYAWMRHPSYVGFFYWGLGTQLTLQNPLSFTVYLVVLWRFFNYRIRGEESHLIRFFGDDYIEYRKRVGTLIPFIP